MCHLQAAQSKGWINAHSLSRLPLQRVRKLIYHDSATLASHNVSAVSTCASYVLDHEFVPFLSMRSPTPARHHSCLVCRWRKSSMMP